MPTKTSVQIDTTTMKIHTDTVFPIPCEGNIRSKPRRLTISKSKEDDAQA